MSNLSFRKPKCIVHDEAVSCSGKYWIFLGHHYHDAGKECWIIGAYNVVTGDTTERHFNLIAWPDNRMGLKNTCTEPKAEALIVWSKFKQEMERKPEHEETDEWSKFIKPFLERERKRQGIDEGQEKGLVM